ncbi:MAG: ECF-type sigma factor [Chthoniobacterales bacterium]
MHDYTQWLNSTRGSTSDNDLVPALYAELKRIAAGKVALERDWHTLNTTALVHEAWLRIEKSAPVEWRDRGQFFGAMAEAMRRILVDAARRRIAAKRGGGAEDIPLEELDLHGSVVDERLMEVHVVLDRLEAEDEIKAQIVKLRFFSGMSNDEIASLLDINEKTVRRHWALAKIWLFRAIGQSD